MPETSEEPVISNDFLASLDLVTDESDKNEEHIDEEKELTLETTIDKSFFTKSMDLNKDDIMEKKNEIDEEVDESFEEENMPVWKVILIIVLVTIVLGLLAYVILRFI